MVWINLLKRNLFYDFIFNIIDIDFQKYFIKILINFLAYKIIKYLGNSISFSVGLRLAKTKEIEISIIKKHSSYLSFNISFVKLSS
jgi:hypothetical protein